MSNTAGCEADAASLCSLPVSGDRNWQFLYFLDGWSQPGGCGCRISCKWETKERLSWSEGAAICDWANLHFEHTWPTAYTVLSSLTRDGTPTRARAHTHAHVRMQTHTMRSTSRPCSCFLGQCCWVSVYVCVCKKEKLVHGVCWWGFSYCLCGLNLK